MTSSANVEADKILSTYMDFGFAGWVFWAAQDLKRKITAGSGELNFHKSSLKKKKNTLQVTLIATIKLGETKELNKWPWKTDLGYLLKKKERLFRWNS